MVTRSSFLPTSIVLLLLTELSMNIQIVILMERMLCCLCLLSLCPGVTGLVVADGQVTRYLLWTDAFGCRQVTYFAIASVAKYQVSRYIDTFQVSAEIALLSLVELVGRRRLSHCGH